MKQRDPAMEVLLRRLLIGGLAGAITICAAITIALLALNVNLLDAIESMVAAGLIALGLGAAAVWSNARQPVANFRIQVIGSIVIALLVAAIAIALPAFALFSVNHDLWLLLLLTGFGLAIGAIVGFISIVALSDSILRLATAASHIAGGDLAARIRPEGTREIWETGAALNAITARAEAMQIGQREVDESRRRLGAAVANDVRGPLDALRTAMQLGGANKSDPRLVEQSLRMVDQETRALAQLLDHLAEMDRIDAGQTVPQRRSASLASLILETLERTRGLAAEHQLALHSHLDRSIPPFLIDEDRIRRVLQHLFEAAIQQTPPGGIVAVELHDQGAEAQVNVVCSGDPARWPAGMADRVAARTNGMGMAIARRLVELHGGRCWVVLPPGHQAVFCFTLPKLLPQPDQA
jgi:signal transduction histidine kinase